jgi:hypothetical protein
MTTESEKQEALRQARKNLAIRFEEPTADEIIARHQRRQADRQHASIEAPSQEKAAEQSRAINSAAWNAWLDARMGERFDLERSVLVGTLGECIRADLDEIVGEFKKLLKDQHEHFELKLRAEVATVRLDCAQRMEATIATLRAALRSGDDKVIDMPPVPPSRSVN